MLVLFHHEALNKLAQPCDVARKRGEMSLRMYPRQPVLPVRHSFCQNNMTAQGS